MDPEAGSFPDGLESALGDGDSVSACVVVLVDSEIDREWGAQASLAVAKRWAASGRRIILADACLDRPVLHEAAGVENGEGMSDMVLYGASLQRIVAPVGERLLLAPAGTPVVRVADVLKHVKLDMMISGCREVGVTLVFHVSTGTPGAQALTERAEGVLVLAPLSQDVDTIVGSESGPLIAVLGPGNGGGRSVADLLGIRLTDPEEEVAGAAEKPLVEPAPLSDLLAEPKAGASPTEDVLAVEGSPGLPEEEEPPVFSVDDSPDLPASEGGEGETSDAFSLTSLEGYDAGDSPALEPDEEEVAGAAEKPVVEPIPLSDLLTKLRTGASPTEDVLAVEELPGLPEEEAPPGFSVDDSPDLPASEGEEGETSDAFSLTSLEGYDAGDLPALEPDEEEVAGAAEKPLVEPAPLSDLLAEPKAGASPTEDVLAVEGSPGLPEEEPPAFSVDDSPDLPVSEGEEGETSDAFSLTSLEGYDAGDSPALEPDEEEVAGAAEKPLVEPAPLSDLLAEPKAGASPTEDVLAVEGSPGLPEEEEPPAFSVDDSPDLPVSEGEEGETSDAFSLTSLEGSQYDAGDSPDEGLGTDVPEAGPVASEAEESTEASGTIVGGDAGVGTSDLDSGADLEVEASVDEDAAATE